MNLDSFYESSPPSREFEFEFYIAMAVFLLNHFPDTTEGGFIVLHAESLDQAAELARSAPIIKNGGYILARPCGDTR